MRRWELAYARPAERKLDAIPQRDAEELRSDLRKLADDPTRRDLDVKKLQPRSAGFYRLRHGKWRAVFRFDKTSQRIVVVSVDDRKDAY